MTLGSGELKIHTSDAALGDSSYCVSKGALESPFITSALDLLSWFQQQALGSRAFLERCNYSYKSLSSLTVTQQLLCRSPGRSTRHR